MNGGFGVLGHLDKKGNRVKRSFLFGIAVALCFLVIARPLLSNILDAGKRVHYLKHILADETRDQYCVSSESEDLRLDHDMQSVSHIYLCGVMDAQRQQYGAALKRFNLLVQKGEREIISFYQIGSVYEERGHHQEAVVWWKRACAEQGFIVQGEAALRNSRLTEARTAFEVALEIKPTSCAALVGLADAEHALGDEEAALQHYEAAITTGCQEGEQAYLARAYLMSGVALGRSGNLDEGVAYLSRAIELAPSDYWNYIMLGDIYRVNGWYDQADFWLEQARDMAPSSVYPLIFLGKNSLARGETEAAMSYAQAAIRIDPTNADALKFLARCESQGMSQE